MICGWWLLSHFEGGGRHNLQHDKVGPILKRTVTTDLCIHRKSSRPRCAVWISIFASCEDNVSVILSRTHSLSNDHVGIDTEHQTRKELFKCQFRGNSSLGTHSIVCFKWSWGIDYRELLWLRFCGCGINHRGKVKDEFWSMSKRSGSWFWSFLIMRLSRATDYKVWILINWTKLTVIWRIFM